MVRNWVLLVLATLSLMGAGCITAETNDDENDMTPPAPVLQNGTRTVSSGIMGPQFHIEDAVVAGGWTFTAPDSIESLTAVLTWTKSENTFSLRTTHDNGTDTAGGADAKASFAPVPPLPGTYTFDVLARGPVLEDEVTLTLTYSWWELPDEVPSGLVSFTEVNGRWRATITHVREATAGALELDLKTFNGGVDVEKVAGDTAKVTVDAWAEADTKERAAELVQAIPVTLQLGDGKMVAKSTGQGVDRARNENIGARIDAEVPASVSGSATTSNGAIEFTDVETTGLKATTSNGGVKGTLTSSGDLDLSTSNGKVAITLVPTGSLDLQASTSNGGIDLTLKESSTIGYKLDASTSNGKISEEMSEASLSGESDTKKTLKTDGYDSRSIKVTGKASTSNGSIEFTGA